MCVCTGSERGMTCGDRTRQRELTRIPTAVPRVVSAPRAGGMCERMTPREASVTGTNTQAQTPPAPVPSGS